MKLPVSISAHRADRKNGGEYVVMKDAEGAWIGDIRAEHIGALLKAIQPEGGDIMERLYQRLAPLAFMPTQVSQEEAKRLGYPHVRLGDVEEAIRAVLEPRELPDEVVGQLDAAALKFMKDMGE